ncbi:unnamed protein product [Prorocentrum cordatum]|uniref:Uncharacterized protein n=1 Tax=Prorocentrum cordatum TaxID=2364126 RepID=A0ABN9QDP3_9DINO|nr:unnamed protein product [Polarella glacialis]
MTMAFATIDVQRTTMIDGSCARSKVVPAIVRGGDGVPDCAATSSRLSSLISAVASSSWRDCGLPVYSMGARVFSTSALRAERVATMRFEESDRDLMTEVWMPAMSLASEELMLSM